MQRQIRPLILIFIISVFLCIIKAVSLVSHLYEYGIKTFSMMAPSNYLLWVLLLSFIHLYIRKNFYAWYVALVVILDFSRWVILNEPPRSEYFPGWYFKAAGFAVSIFFIFYMLLNYRAYKAYTTGTYIETGRLNNSTGKPVIPPYFNSLSQNPIRGVFNVAILILIFNGFSLVSKLTEQGISATFLNMSPTSIWFWLLDLIFIYSYLRKKYFAWHLAMLGTVSMLLFALFKQSNTDYMLPAWQLKLFSFALWLAAVGYLFIKWKRYKSYVSDSNAKGS